jgi:XTP/dITP diphosphohydrolase
METILLASGNPGKLVEIQEILADLSHLQVEVLLPAALNLYLDILEDGNTYAENASRKALAYVKASGLVTLADDSGLEVDVLGGQPGIHSARYGGEPGMPAGTDASRRAFLINQLQGHPPPWQASFHCTVAVAHPDGRIFFTGGECPGRISSQERGEGGFGYDPVFIPEEENRSGLTMAELGMDVKNRISHRAKAVRAAFPLLVKILG